jgi:sodium/proline symporter
VSRSSAILITLILYKVILVAIGWLAHRRTRDDADFFLGGRRLGAMVAALSASASSSSAWTLLGVSGAAYAWGVSAIWLFPACVGGFCLNWFLLAPRLRRLSHRSGALTTTDVLAGHGPGSHRLRVLASLIILVSLCTYIASQFQGAGKTFSETFDLPLHGSILIGSGIVVLYTLLGGFWAVSLTDTLQGMMMALSALVIPVAAVVAVGGPAAVVEGMGAVPVDGYMSPVRGAPLVVGAGFVLGLLGIGLGYPGQPHVVNRFMALRDEAALVRGRRIALAWATLVYAGMLVLGWAGRVLVSTLADNEVIFIAVTHRLFHPVVAGVMIAAVMSAIMSTADSQLLVAASSVAHDLPIRSRLGTLAGSRWVVLLLSGVAVITSLVGTTEIFSRVLFAWTAMGSAFGPLILVRIWRGPVRSGFALASMGTGFALAVAAYLEPATRGGVGERVLPFLIAAWLALRGARRY